jgi:hypothetical protein
VPAGASIAAPPLPPLTPPLPLVPPDAGAPLPPEPTVPPLAVPPTSAPPAASEIGFPLSLCALHAANNNPDAAAHQKG